VRTCPECTHGKLEAATLSQGCECPHCHKIIEVDTTYSYGIPILLVLIVSLAFSYDFGVIGIGATIALLLFTAGYRSVWTEYLPLKHYGE
jgi:uncharacterized paraquat-inducible protein A